MAKFGLILALFLLLYEINLPLLLSISIPFDQSLIYWAYLQLLLSKNHLNTSDLLYLQVLYLLLNLSLPHHQEIYSFCLFYFYLFYALFRRDSMWLSHLSWFTMLGFFFFYCFCSFYFFFLQNFNFLRIFKFRFRVFFNCWHFIKFWLKFFD